MVVLLDLDEDLLDPHLDPRDITRPGFQFDGTVTRRLLNKEIPLETEEWPTLNINGFSAALGCYPVVSQIAYSIDLNTLHALSRTCRRFRLSLLQFRKRLVQQTLRCENETQGQWPFKDEETRNLELESTWSLFSNRLTSGKVGACARDMVSDCRRCGRIVCRNCTLKPPSASTLQNRHRRLCSACLATPLSFLTNPFTTPFAPSVFTTPAFSRGPCCCQEMVYLCQPCGQGLANVDTTYKRIWTWRTRYSTYLGGLGTGIGEGNEGVKCGRGESCFGAKETVFEIDCGAEELSPATTPQGESEEWAVDKAGYLRQEMEGIGGVVKKKVKKRVRVGKTVREHEDERERAEYLGREIRGDERSWCAWCWRVVPGRRDREELQADGS